MHSIATPLFCLMVAVSIWPAPVSGSDYRDTFKGSFCEAGGYMEYRVLSAADGTRTLHRLPDGPADVRKIEGVRKIENVPIVFDSAGNSHETRSPAGGVGERQQDAKLSLLQNTPLPFQDTSRARDNSRTGNKRQGAEWVPVPDSPMPEPGTWAVLIAGFLGICAVARPRIFSS